MSDAGITGEARSAAQREAFEGLIGAQSSTVQQLAREARRLVQEVMPGVIESVWPQQGTCSYGTGPKKMSQHFVYFTFAKAHLGLGFYQGASLADPEGLLEGTGKKMRRAKIADAKQLASPALRRLIEEASRLVPPLAS